MMSCCKVVPGNDTKVPVGGLLQQSPIIMQMYTLSESAGGALAHNPSFGA